MLARHLLCLCAFALGAQAVCIPSLAQSSGPMTIDDVVDLVTQNNPEMKNLALNVRARQNEYSRAKNDMLPVVIVEAANHRTLDQIHFNEAGIEMTAVLYTGGKRRARAEQKKLGLEKEKLATAESQELIRLRARKVVLNLLQHRRAILTIKTATELLRLTELNASQNVSAESDSLASKSRHDVDQLLFKNSSYGLTQKMRSAQRLFSQNCNSLLELADTEDRTLCANIQDNLAPARPNLTSEEAVAHAMTVRADVLQAKLAIQQSEQALKVANAGRKPEIFANVGVSRTNDPMVDGVRNSANGRNYVTAPHAVVGIQLNLFDRKRKNDITAAEISQDQAKNRERNTRLAALTEIKNIYLSLNDGFEDMTTAEALVNNSSAAFKAAQAAYKMNTTSGQDMITIFEKHIDSMLARNAAHFQTLETIYNLKFIVGLE